MVDMVIHISQTHHYKVELNIKHDDYFLDTMKILAFLNICLHCDCLICSTPEILEVKGPLFVHSQYFTCWSPDDTATVLTYFSLNITTQVAGELFHIR